jgi:hypothetical protein
MRDIRVFSRLIAGAVHFELLTWSFLGTSKLRAAKIDRRVLIKLADIEQMLADNPA